MITGRVVKDNVDEPNYNDRIKDMISDSINSKQDTFGTCVKPEVLL